jgi:UDPglucose--hexose-1-phosphate uridylyltransferase
MGILRKDYILNRWVYYATERKKRLVEFAKEQKTVESKTCFFCPGNEHLTPKEIGRVEYKNAWKMRWFANKFPAVETKNKFCLKSKKYYVQGNTYGRHEIIVETNDHKKQLWDLNVQEIQELFDVYALRIKALSKLRDVRYVTVFKNHGPQGGTSLVHSHTQITTMPVLPQQIMDEILAARKLGRCPYCDIIRSESKSKRKIMESKNAVAFSPFASRFNYEAWIVPKRHIGSIAEMNGKELLDTAEALKKILGQLKRLNASYNFFLHYAPKGKDLHFHIEITPRIANWGGFEISTGATINSVLPEEAAKFYRGN